MKKWMVVAWVVFTARTCLAWNSTGHETVAQIAYDNLSPPTRAKIILVLQQHPRLKEDLLLGIGPGEDPDRAIFLRAATWPDMIRSPINPMSHTEHHGRWHYVDYPFDFDGVAGPEPVEHWDGKSDPANLLQAMEKAKKELADPQTPLARKAIDLCWVEHLVGDIHQPLHAASMFSKEYPNGDQGGNLVIVHNDGKLFVGAPTINLHTIWDGQEGLSMDPAVVRQIADRIEKEHPLDASKDAVANLDVIAWAKESFAMAKSKVYLDGTLAHITRDQANDKPDSAPPLPDGYEAAALDVADQRIALAGYRLAATLEEIAGNW
jgi:S1/P1 Nuclease